MNRNIIIGIGIVIVAGVLFLIASNRNADTDIDQSVDQSIKQSDFDRLSAITLVDYEGNTVSLGEFKGRPLVINSWAVWCPFCRAELPDFTELQKEFGNRIVVIAIDRKESLKKAKGFTDGLGITDDLLFLLDAKDSFYKSIGGFSMPETLFINSEGEIVVHKRGFMALDEMRDHTNKIISSNEVSL